MMPSEFEPCKDRWDGRRTICRECINVARRARYVKKGRPAKRGPYDMTVTGSAAISRAVSRRMTGSGNPRWKGGKATNWRSTPEYVWWRAQVLQRDNYTCRWCGDNKGGNLTAHHIVPVEDSPNLALEINNGITLCEKCHSREHGVPVRGSRHKDTEMTVCACGCGTAMKRWATRKSTRPRRYLPGHFIRVLHERQRKNDEGK